VNTLLELQGIRRSFGGRRGQPAVAAVDGIDLQVNEGTALGIVGESGSGKSTLGRIIVGLEKADAGTADFAGTRIVGSGRPRPRHLRRDLQMVFQDPYSSLDPSWTIGSTLREPLRNFGIGRRGEWDDRVGDLLRRVGLDEQIAERLPSELSGGQRQRVAIARALAPEPRLIVADEAVSALDVSTQAEIINLLSRLREESRLTFIFISHDMSVVRHFSDYVAVMRHGQVLEVGSVRDVFEDPEHEYTRQLMDAAPAL